MFLLSTPGKMKVEVLTKNLRNQIQPFSLPGKPTPIQYTNDKGKVIKPPKRSTNIVDLLPTIEFTKDCHLYSTKMDKNDLMLVKLYLPHACRIYVTNSNFIDRILPLLDILILTTSTKVSVEMDMWLPNEDATVFTATMDGLREIVPNMTLTMQRAVALYNKHAPNALLQARTLQISAFRDGTSVIISRNFIAQIIKTKFVKDNIRLYSSNNQSEECSYIQE